MSRYKKPQEFAKLRKRNKETLEQLYLRDKQLREAEMCRDEYKKLIDSLTARIADLEADLSVSESDRNLALRAQLRTICGVKDSLKKELDALKAAQEWHPASDRPEHTDMVEGQWGTKHEKAN